MASKRVMATILPLAKCPKCGSCKMAVVGRIGRGKDAYHLLCCTYFSCEAVARIPCSNPQADPELVNRTMTPHQQVTFKKVIGELHDLVPGSLTSFRCPECDSRMIYHGIYQEDKSGRHLHILVCSARSDDATCPGVVGVSGLTSLISETVWLNRQMESRGIRAMLGEEEAPTPLPLLDVSQILPRKVVPITETFPIGMLKLPAHSYAEKKGVIIIPFGGNVRNEPVARVPMGYATCLSPYNPDSSLLIGGIGRIEKIREQIRRAEAASATIVNARARIAKIMEGRDPV